MCVGKFSRERVKANNHQLLNREHGIAAEIHSNLCELKWQFLMMNWPFAGSLEYQHWVTFVIHSSGHTFNAKRKGKYVD